MSAAISGKTGDSSETKSLTKDIDLILVTNDYQCPGGTVGAIYKYIGDGGTTGVGVSGAGVYTENRIQSNVKSYIDGDGGFGITVSSLRLQSLDTSTILAASVAGTGAVSFSIGLALANNEIRKQVEASISEANIRAWTGDVIVRAGAAEDSAGLPGDYDTTSGTVALKKGDSVKAADGQVYRFLGKGEKIQTTYKSSAGEVYLKNGDIVKSWRRRTRAAPSTSTSDQTPPRISDYDPITDATVATTNVWGLEPAGDLTLRTSTNQEEPGSTTYRKGITFKDVEVAKVLLGQGDDTFTVNDTMAAPDGTVGALTSIEGGGNRLATGGDNIIVNGGGGAGSPLVVFGDTSQDGLDYAGVSRIPSIHGISFTYSGTSWASRIWIRIAGT